MKLAYLLVLVIVVSAITSNLAKTETLNGELATYKKDRNSRIDVVTFVMWCEDHSRIQGMKFVRDVIYTRARSKSIYTMYQIVTAPGQFECWTNRTSIMSRMTDFNRKELKTAKSMLINFITSDEKPLIKAMYFYNWRIMPIPPYWAKGLDIVVIDHNHVYLDDRS